MMVLFQGCGALITAPLASDCCIVVESDVNVPRAEKQRERRGRDRPCCALTPWQRDGTAGGTLGVNSHREMIEQLFRSASWKSAVKHSREEKSNHPFGGAYQEIWLGSPLSSACL